MAKPHVESECEDADEIAAESRYRLFASRAFGPFVIIFLVLPVYRSNIGRRWWRLHDVHL
jgi:hypothetical protein